MSICGGTWPRREHAIALAARPILEAHVLQHDHLRRHDVGLLGDDLADARALLAALPRQPQLLFQPLDLERLLARQRL